MDADKNVVRDRRAFVTTAGGYRFEATYLIEPKGKALVEISNADGFVYSFLCEAYRVWNVAAHAEDMAAELDAKKREEQE